MFRRPRAHHTRLRAPRSHRPAVGDPPTTPAGRYEARPPTQVDQTPAHRRDPMADPDRVALARRSSLLRAVADGLRLVPPAADGTWQRILTALHALADQAGLITWDVSVDTTIVRAHQHAAGARKRGICRPSPAVDPDHRRAARRQPTVRRRPRPDPRPSVWAGTAPHAAGPGAGGQGLQFQGQPGLSTPAWDPVHDPGQGRSGRQPAKALGQGVAGRQRSTPRSTSSVMPWTAGSTCSNSTVASRPGSTSLPCATRPPS
jgi:hypothetical protein